VARFVVVDSGKTDPYAELVGRLRRPRALLKQMGAMMESASQEAFTLQRLGDIEWPHRYPNQGEPFVNVAGLVSDLNRGATIKERRFQRRPALQDTGQLGASIRSRVVSDDRVEVGTPLERGATHQYGLTSQQPITPEAKKGLSKWLLSDQGRPFQKKLSFLLMPARRTLDTQVVERPFLGITDELEDDMVELIEEVLASE